MSIVNMMKDQQAWSMGRICRRAASMLRTSLTTDAEQNLTRKLNRTAAGRHSLSVDDETEIDVAEAAWTAHDTIIETAMVESALLAEVLAYEAAKRDVDRLSLLLDGRPESPVLVDQEQIDPETGDLVTAQVQIGVLPAVAAMPGPDDLDDGDGGSVRSPRGRMVDQRAAAQAILDAATPEALVWVAARAPSPGG